MVINKSRKSLTINPLKVSQTVGGVLALQGLLKAIPIVHGSQGCAAFIKALMSQHYRDPISIQTTALQEMNIIFGAEQSLIEALDVVIEMHDPSIIAVLSTALTETTGDDLLKNIKDYNKEHASSNRLLIPIMLPDFLGSLESGYALTVEKIISGIIELRKDEISECKMENQINLLPASYMTPSDVMEVKKILKAFGFEVITIPDVSTALSSTLIKGYSPLTQGGLSLEKLKMMLTSELTIAIGTGQEKAGKLLEREAGIPCHLFPSLTGLKANDAFFSFLQTYSEKIVPDIYQWERDSLVDCMLDSHFYFSGKKIVVALEPDHLYSIVEICKEMGCIISGLVTSFPTQLLSEIEDEVLIGDLDDLEDMSDSADVWISNSHGEKGAGRKKLSFIPLGFPVFNEIGSSMQTSVGYHGTMEIIVKIGNSVIKERR